VIVEGRAVVIPGADVDTDVMYPGQYLNIDDPEQMKPYLFEGFDPSLREQLGDDAILVTGPNFGIGSSREHVPQAMKAWGVQAVVGPSFARIFRRNCVNLGLLAVEAAEAAAAARPGSAIRIDTDAGEVEVDGQRFGAAPIAPLVEELQSAGGLVAHARGRVGP
jgi:3-isopropylmalate/(R)-2-methylmalate dehydratase small subunit